MTQEEIEQEFKDRGLSLDFDTSSMRDFKAFTNYIANKFEGNKMKKEESLLYKLAKLRNKYEDRVRENPHSFTADSEHFTELSILIEEFEITKRYIMEKIK